MEKAKNIVFSTALAAGLTVSPGGGSEELNDSYESSHLQVVENELNLADLNLADDIEFPNIPAEPAQNIELSDDFDGLLTGQGFTVYFDEERLKASLEPNEAVIVQQTEAVNTLYGPLEFEARRVVDTFEASHIRGDFINIMPDIYDSSNYAIGNAGYYTNDQIPGNFTAIGDGLDPHVTRPARITLTHYSLNEDGSFDILSEESATAEIAPNVQCEADLYIAPMQVASETVPTAQQKNVMCNTVQTYQDLLPPGFDIHFDATRNSSGIDSASDHDPDDRSSGGSIVLTYYKNGNEEISPESLEQIALHETLHTTYYEADEEIKQQLKDAYILVVSQMSHNLREYEQQVWRGSSRGLEPILDCITESTYHQPGSRVGHPWDNATEMTSSLATVLAYYPDEFLENFDKIDRNSQAAIVEAIHAMGALVSSRTNVESIIPDYYDILEVIES